MPYQDFRQFRRAAAARRAHRRQPAGGVERRRQGDEAELCAAGPRHHVQPEWHGLSAGRRRLLYTQQGPARFRGGRGHALRQSSERARQPDCPDGDLRQPAVPGRGHHRWTRSISGVGRSRSTARRTVAPTSRQELWCRRIPRPACPISATTAFWFSARRRLVLGAAVPSLRQASGQAQAPRHRAQGRAGDRRRSGPRLYLPGAGARRHQRLERGRRLARRAGGAAHRVTSELAVPATSEVVIEFEVDLHRTVWRGRSANIPATTPGRRRSRSPA